MEFAYLSELSEDALVLREVDGDIDAYGGVGPGFSLPRRDARGVTRWSPAKCRSWSPTPRTLPQAAGHPFVTATGIRAYAGVPVRRGDGTLSARCAA